MPNVLTTMQWVWLAKNGMLAMVPVIAAYALRNLLDKRPTSVVRYGVAAGVAVVWFVFLPNTCYLLTEWRHYFFVLDAENLYLRAASNSILFIELLLGTLFYFVYALFGMMTFTLAIRRSARTPFADRRTHA